MNVLLWSSIGTFLQSEDKRSGGSFLMCDTDIERRACLFSRQKKHNQGQQNNSRNKLSKLFWRLDTGRAHIEIIYDKMFRANGAKSYSSSRISIVRICPHRQFILFACIV